MKNYKSLRLTVAAALLVATTLFSLQALGGLRGTCWCCYYQPDPSPNAGLQVIQTTTLDCKKKHGHCYATQAQAQKACSATCWCCFFSPRAQGKIFDQEPSILCAQSGGTCYATQQAANAHCH